MVTLYECSGCGYFEAWECPRCDKVCVGCGEVVRDPHWGKEKDYECEKCKNKKGEK